jgi:hypothetical protein
MIDEICRSGFAAFLAAEVVMRLVRCCFQLRKHTIWHLLRFGCSLDSFLGAKPAKWTD